MPVILHKLIRFILPLLPVFIISWLGLARTYPDLKFTTPFLDSHLERVQVAPEPLVPSSEFLKVKKVDWPKPKEVRGIYVTGWIAGSSKWFPRIIEFIKETEVNSLVIDVKDDTGTLSYHSEVPLAKEIGASQKKIRNLPEIMTVLRENQIFPIARVVVFKDPFLAQRKPEWAVHDSHGGLWKDRKGLNWVDPNNKLVWDYIIDICKEAINLGFQEIQFDYVRFTSDGDLTRCVYPYSTGKLRQDVIREFLQYAREKLKPYDIPISVDIFGLTTSVPDDMGIGQQFEKISECVDIVCPMVYPSHYANGSYGYKIPDLHPYETVYRGVTDAKKRIELAGQKTQLRPWLQDFSLGNPYGRAQIQAQIKAVKDAGIKEWIFWNPGCKYDNRKYN